MPFKDKQKSREYHKEYNKKDYLKNKDKEQFRSRMKAYRLAHPEVSRKAVRKFCLKRYGLTMEQFDELHEKQRGVCAICGKENVNGRYLTVDQ